MSLWIRVLCVHKRYLLQKQKSKREYLCKHVNNTQLCEKMQSGVIEYSNYSAIANLTRSQFSIFQSKHKKQTQ